MLLVCGRCRGGDRSLLVDGWQCASSKTLLASHSRHGAGRLGGGLGHAAVALVIGAGVSDQVVSAVGGHSVVAVAVVPSIDDVLVPLRPRVAAASRAAAIVAVVAATVLVVVATPTGATAVPVGATARPSWLAVRLLAKARAGVLTRSQNSVSLSAACATKTVVG
jgi:hypothetical protein